MKRRDFLTSEFTAMLLSQIRDNGFLTAVSNDASINRTKMNRTGFAKLRVHQLLRILVALSFHLSRRSPKAFLAMWWQLGLLIQAMSEDDYDEFCNEGSR